MTHDWFRWPDWATAQHCARDGCDAPDWVDGEPEPDVSCTGRDE